MSDDNSNPDARTFEELCRAHIQAFSRGAEQYAVETNLSQRVGQWQQRLAPILEEEEDRPVFDMHEYGKTIISTMERKVSKGTRVVDFASVTRGLPQYDVCRMFLASLSLSNDGNVVPQARDPTGNRFQLELHHSEIARPMETYLAPSVANQVI